MPIDILGGSAEVDFSLKNFDCLFTPRSVAVIGASEGFAKWGFGIFNQVPGTWFLSPGWTRMGTEFVFRELQINRIAKKNVPPLELARRMLDGFTRALYIDMDLGVNTDELEGKARKIADDLGLCLVRTTGSLNLLEKTVLKALATKRSGL